MPITRYSIDDIHQHMLNTMINHSGENSIRLDAHPLNLLAKASAGTIAGLYDALEDAIKGSFATTATGSDLDRLGLIWNIQRGAPTYAKAKISITGDENSIIPEQSLLSNANGLLYETDETITLDATGKATLAITATQVGDAQNLTAQEELSWQLPIAGVSSYGVALEESIIKAVDAESDYQFRQRILLELRNPRKVGTASDYHIWGLARQTHGVAVSKVFVRGAVPQPGSIKIFIVIEEDDDFLNLPNQAQIEKVKAYIDTQRPVGTTIAVVAPILEQADITIADLQIEDTEQVIDVQKNIRYQLSALFLRNADLGASIGLNQLYETISNVKGVKSFSLAAPTSGLTPASNTTILKPNVSFIVT